MTCSYVARVEIEYDPLKNAANTAKHGIALAAFRKFDSEPATFVDDRYDYGEVRFRSIGRIGGMPHVIVFTETAAGIRLISFRRAHEKEIRRYE